MVENHPGAREPHDVPDFPTHICVITMYTAVGTEGLSLHKGTFVTAQSRVSIQHSTVGTKIFAAMFFTAVNFDHQHKKRVCCKTFILQQTLYD